MIEMKFKDKDAARFVHQKVRAVFQHTHDTDRFYATRAINSTIQLPDVVALKRAQEYAETIQAKYRVE